ncbi:zinc-binding alcohol dehydrogenase family protein [Chitinophaga sp. GbtcB8]|uniref:quinone oxidoreductase family protein n=1 Tax=Chitinophaga sp. GbtcB8 TaxID=2824753 RepID=UPI001C2F73B4|nr:zinc-binding alcohol dehydrogenase family protein [Chitinophaga sp. GbtcB8]
MKAAVMYQRGGMPQYVDFPEPVAQKNELLIFMKAAAIKQLDRSMASGRHYSVQNDPEQATIIGGDGVGVLENGTRVYAVGATGMIAEKAVIEKDRMVPLPSGIDDVTAAALPNAVFGSAMGLRFRACMKKGETVLINGATGFTGKIAVQVAKYYGAKRIIVTGRNKQTLQSLLALGADEIITLEQEDEAFVAQIKAIHNRTPIDIILDYLWGHTAELILSAFKGQGMFTYKTRFVSIGSMAGDLIQLSAENLRSVDLQLTGSGLGSWTKPEVQELLKKILPEMFKLAAAGKLKVETVSVDLKDIASLWDLDIPGGQRLVVTI